MLHNPFHKFLFSPLVVRLPEGWKEGTKRIFQREGLVAVELVRKPSWSCHCHSSCLTNRLRARGATYSSFVQGRCHRAVCSWQWPRTWKCSRSASMSLRRRYSFPTQLSIIWAILWNPGVCPPSSRAFKPQVINKKLWIISCRKVEMRRRRLYLVSLRIGELRTMRVS